MSMDRLVELFLQSARADDAGPVVHEPDEEGIAKAVDTVEKMLTSQDAAAMVGTPDATFVCLAMALEEKPKLQLAAIGCYEKALQYCSKRRANGGWERCVVLQQLGAVCLRHGMLQKADAWLAECSEACAQTEGHPREAVLFNGSFSTSQTRLEFASMVEKLRAKTCMGLGDQQGAHAHVNEAKRLQDATTGDAVERQAALGPPAASSPSNVDPIKQLWAETPCEEKCLKEYHFMDEGPTVLVMLDLNQHLGIGDEASAAVESLRQFKVKCEEKSVDIQLRLRRQDGRITHFRLLLEPLSREIVPEDTVPKLRGKESKRRLEVKLFKRDKQQKWFGDLVSEKAVKPKEDQPAGKSKSSTAAPPAAAKGSLLNPLTPEELSRLPKPGESVDDNRPSSWRQAEVEAGSAPRSTSNGNVNGVSSVGGSSYPQQATHEQKQAPPLVSPAKPVSTASSDDIPAWIAKVEREQDADSSLFKIYVAESVADVSMRDLELDADEVGRRLSLKLLKDDVKGVGEKDMLSVAIPSGADLAQLEARWRKKTRALEIRLPVRR